MNANSCKLLAAVAGLLLAASATAKLPAPSDEAKAKAAEAAAKTAHGNKLANYQLCVSMEKVAAGYFATTKQAGKEIKPATATPPCENPGPFVYVPPAPAGAASAAPTAPTAPAAPAAAAPPAAAPAPASPKK